MSEGNGALYYRVPARLLEEVVEALGSLRFGDLHVTVTYPVQPSPEPPLLRVAVLGPNFTAQELEIANQVMVEEFQITPLTVEVLWPRPRSRKQG